MVDKLIEECDGNRFNISSSTVGSTFIHETSLKISKVFKEARKAASLDQPSFIVIDEADSLLRDRENGSQTRIDEVNTLLQEMAHNQNKNLYVFLMTNNPGDLDISAIRNGRINSRFELGLPNLKDRKEILEFYLSELPYSKYDEFKNPNGINLDRLARQTQDYTVSDLQALVDAARNSAANAEMEYIDSEAIKVALAEVKRSLTDEQIAKYEECARKFRSDK